MNRQFNLICKTFKANERPFDRASFRNNAPKAHVAQPGLLASLLALIGL